jgi:hypothetical protein
MVAIITPNWLKVDKAIIFLMSHSVMALSPAIVVVVVAIISNVTLNNLFRLIKG